MDTNIIKKLYFKDTSFANLMRYRIYNVLLYASKYDAFSLEEDGRVDEVMFNEYTALNLRYPPRFTLVSDEQEANLELETKSYDLIISMPSGDSINPFEWAKKVKKDFEDIPIVLLTPFSRMVSERLVNEDLSAIDYVFSWLGNSDLLLAIVKLIEDSMNVQEDVASVGVQVILLVEDSIRFYSSLLPHIYKFVFNQSRSFMTEALNEHEQMLRMRGRPKILLARSYEEATHIYNKYSNNMSGIITDVSYLMGGKKEPIAGIKLCQEVRKKDNFIPLIVLSTDQSNHQYADKVQAAFIHKLSKTYILELRKIISNNFGFGDFVFINPTTGLAEAKISNLRDLQENIFTLSDESLYYHISRNNISKWLYSRAMFPLAEFLRKIQIGQEATTTYLQQARQIIFDAIVSYRKIKNQGIIAVFQRDRFDKYSNFARIGEGSMGGKGRGLAFIDSMIKFNTRFECFEHTDIRIPRTVVICTDIFAEFMEINDLYPLVLSEQKDEQILKYFLKAQLPKKVVADLYAFLDVIESPVAIRSSSLLEDSHYQPFAGVYSTYMVPHDSQSKTNMLMMMIEAIKAVYASVFYQESKAYMVATKNVIDEEKMAVVLQEVCGKYYGDGSRFYPSFSGVARSLNFYPIGAEKPEEGIVNIAMGLGKYIVDGGLSLRFSMFYPNNILQTSTLDLALRETQTQFYAIDAREKRFVPSVDDGSNLLKIRVQDAIEDGSLQYIASTFNPQDQMIYDNIYEKGRKVITFANILQHNVFPLAEIMKEVLHTAQKEMGRSVEIEFAVQLDYSENPRHKFYLLQIRPIVDNRETITENIGAIAIDNTIVSCSNAMGHGICNDLYDILYVKPNAFNASKNQLIAYEIEKINKMMVEQDRPYILVGPGRWGSADEWLGIPVKWAYISNAKLIVESGLENYRIDPSQGTHFFQNLTSLGVFYFTINTYNKEGSYDVNFLDNASAEYESEYLRLVHFDKPMVAKVDGRKKIGVVMKP